MGEVFFVQLLYVSDCLICFTGLEGAFPFLSCCNENKLRTSQAFNENSLTYMEKLELAAATTYRLCISQLNLTGCARLRRCFTPFLSGCVIRGEAELLLLQTVRTK